MQTLKKGLVSNTWPREKSCGHCNAVVSFDKTDLFKTDEGKPAFSCPECGRPQVIKDVLHINDEKRLPSYEEFIAGTDNGDS